MIGYFLETRMADQEETEQQICLWSKDSVNSTIYHRLAEQTLNWKVVEVLPWLTP